ncbi:MAG: hypothetical protein V4858_26585 [Pseudomonadota bacterium]
MTIRQLFHILSISFGRRCQLFRRMVWLVLGLAAAYVPIAHASSVITPKTSVSVSIGGGYPVTIINTAFIGKEPLFVQGTVDWVEPFFHTAFAKGADTYFGVIWPGTTQVSTWSPDGSGAITLRSGYAPMARASSVLNPTAFSTNAMNGGLPIRYQFTGQEPKGLYLLFLFMVPTGADPSDIQNWAFLATAPFFLK